MRLITSPNRPDFNSRRFFTIFLGGSIDMGAAEDWQVKLASDLSGYDDDLVLFNPRRLQWDASLPQDPTPGTTFHYQVAWEFEYQDESNINVYYFGDNSPAPISLLELGSYGTEFPYQTVVRCSPNFYRYGNVNMFCKKHGITLVHTYDELLNVLKYRIDKEFYHG